MEYEEQKCETTPLIERLDHIIQWVNTKKNNVPFDDFTRTREKRNKVYKIKRLMS